MAETAKLLDAVEDERHALSQLVMMNPAESSYAQRLQEINVAHGFETVELPQNKKVSAAPVFENFSATETTDLNEQDEQFYNGNGSFDFADDEEETHIIQPDDFTQDVRDFNFYNDAAVICDGDDDIEMAAEEADSPAVEPERKQAEAVVPETPKTAANVEVDPFRDLKSEFGFEDGETQTENDYETHYQTAVSYQEMGLMEDAIKEFQEAINLVKNDDGTRRFFQCSNLLGHCFMEKEMPNLALMWFKRCLELPGLGDEKHQALYYELGCYEAGGDSEKAIEYFEKLYAENVNFRDVGKRLENLQQNR